MVRFTERELDETIRAGRVHHDVSRLGESGVLMYESGTSRYGGRYLRDVDGFLWATPYDVRPEHLPSGSDPALLFRDEPGTELVGYWRSPGRKSVTPDGRSIPFTIDELRASDPDWFDGPEMGEDERKTIIEFIDRGAGYSQRYCGYSLNRLTGELNGTSTYYFVGSSLKEVFAVPEGFTAYLRAGMRPNMPGWLKFLFEFRRGGFVHYSVPDTNAHKYLYYLIGSSEAAEAEKFTTRVRRALGFDTIVAPIA